LEGGLETQLDVADRREVALAAALEQVRQLEWQLGEKDELVTQLEGAVYALEEERDQLKRDLHEANYAHARREEEIMAALAGREVSGGRMHALSTKVRAVRGTRGERALSGASSSLADYEREIVGCREQVRTL
jgi:chromosome segregation ATPase